MTRTNPFGFTQAGANMLSVVLNSPVAVERSKQIVLAFTTMEKQATADRLRKARQAERRAEIEWQANRSAGKQVRRAETDAIKAFVEYARGQGSTHAEKYYMIISKMVNTAFLGEQAAGNPHFRDTLDAAQLMTLAMGERVAGLALLEAMALSLPYKACFLAAKARVVALAAMMGGVGTFPQLAGPANSPGTLRVAV